MSDAAANGPQREDHSWHLHLVAGLVEPCGLCLLLLAVTVREIPKVLLHFLAAPRGL